MNFTSRTPVPAFIHELVWSDLPRDVQLSAKRSLVDLLAALIAGSVTKLGRLVGQFAAAQFQGNQAQIALSELRATAAGAAMANGMAIDAMDSHDGHRLAKGHAGSGILPAVMAQAEGLGWSGPSMLTSMAVGYEIGLRAAIALHRTAQDYHSSGAWVSLGAAAVCARAAGLDSQATRHALGIAEYHGPRSPMMRCIDHPTMLKDGAGWGSLNGVLASGLAQKGFTGAPAELVEADDVSELWEDLGSRWRMRELYLKPYACCRWAQPSLHAALSLQREHDFEPKDVVRVEVETFAEAARLTVARPDDTEQAQYSLPYALAAALVAGRMGPEQVQEPFLREERVLQIADRVQLGVDPEIDAAFPAQALARVRLELADGSRFSSEVVGAPGDPDRPLTDQQVDEKFQQFTRPVVGDERSNAILDSARTIDESDNAWDLLGLLAGFPE